MRNIVLKIIELYQQSLSPDHGPLKTLYPYGFCRHEPTCSNYAKEIIADKGMLVGITKSLCRVLSCNPWRKPSEKRILTILQKQ